MLKRARSASSSPLAGGRSVSQPGFENIETGQTRSQVREILGRPSSTYTRVTEDDGTVIRLERWQYGDSMSTLATGLVFSDFPSDSVWSVFFDEDGRVVRVQGLDPDAEERNSVQLRRMQDPIDPGVPSRSR